MNKRRLKYVASIVAGQSPSGEDVTEAGDFPFLQGCAEFGDKYPVPTKFCSAPPKRAHKGAWLISVRAPVGQLNYADQDYGIGRGVAGISAKTIDRHFLGYILRHSVATLRSIATGSTYEAVSAGQVGNLSIPYPDIATQQAIADFLDRETARIDQLVGKKQRLIERLFEKRGAYITNIISGGVEAGSARVQTNNGWFPFIPKDWNLARLKDVSRVISDGPHISPEYVDEGIPFISARNVKVDRWQLEDAKYISDDLYKELCRKSKPEIGDVLYTKGGTTGIARVVDLRCDFHIWVHIALIKLRYKIADPYFIAYALNSSSCYDQAQLFTRGATNNDLGLSRMANICFPLPPLDVQLSIAREANRVTEKLDSAGHSVDLSIERLREFHSALITAAVTGQIDVAIWGKRGETDCRLDRIEEKMRA